MTVQLPLLVSVESWGSIKQCRSVQSDNPLPLAQSTRWAFNAYLIGLVFQGKSRIFDAGGTPRKSEVACLLAA